MSLKLKVIKSKEFTVDTAKHTHFTCAYKGRVFSVSTIRWEGVKLKPVNNVLTLPSECEVLKHTSSDPIDGTTRVFLDIVPSLGLVLADI